jgi:hypothetical protein
LPRVQALEARVSAIQGVANQALTAAQSESTPPSGYWNWLPAPEVIYSSSDSSSPGVAWTSYSFRTIPGSATEVLLYVYGRRDDGVTGMLTAYAGVSQNGPNTPIYQGFSLGIDNDTNGAFSQIDVPVSNGLMAYTLPAGVYNWLVEAVAYR